MGFIRRLARTAKRIVRSPVGAFAIGGFVGLGLYNMGKRSAKKATRARGYEPVARHCCHRHLAHPMSMCSPGGIGAFSAMAASATSHMQLAHLAHLASRTPAWHHPVGRANMTSILAAHHARISYAHLSFPY